MHIQNASVFERSLLYKYVCETWRLIRLNSKINPHIRKFANPKNQWFSDPFAVHICNDIYYWSDDTCKLCTCIWCPFWLNTTCMKVHISSGVARQIARKLTLTCIYFFFWRKFEYKEHFSLKSGRAGLSFGQDIFFMCDGDVC